MPTMLILREFIVSLHAGPLPSGDFSTASKVGEETFLSFNIPFLLSIGIGGCTMLLTRHFLSYAALIAILCEEKNTTQT